MQCERQLLCTDHALKASIVTGATLIGPLIPLATSARDDHSLQHPHSPSQKAACLTDSLPAALMVVIVLCASETRRSHRAMLPSRLAVMTFMPHTSTHVTISAQHIIKSQDTARHMAEEGPALHSRRCGVAHQGINRDIFFGFWESRQTPPQPAHHPAICHLQFLVSPCYYNRLGLLKCRTNAWLQQSVCCVAGSARHAALAS
jgi:hypothetical protein